MSGYQHWQREAARFEAEQRRAQYEHAEKQRIAEAEKQARIDEQTQAAERAARPFRQAAEDMTRRLEATIGALTAKIEALEKQVQRRDGATAADFADAEVCGDAYWDAREEYLRNKAQKTEEEQVRINSTPAFAPAPLPSKPPRTRADVALAFTARRRRLHANTTNTTTQQQENNMAPPNNNTAQAEVVESPSSLAARNFAGDFANAAVRGSKVGAATQLNTMLVEGVLKLFPQDGMAAMVINTDMGRQVLRLVVPFALGTIASIAPNLIPSVVDASLVRRVCLYAAEGEAAHIVGPALARMSDLLKGVVAAGVRSGIDMAGIDPKAKSDAEAWAAEAERDEKQRKRDAEHLEAVRDAAREAAREAMRERTADAGAK